MTQERDQSGRFVKGNSGNPKGRPPRETERYFLDLFRSSVSDADFQKVITALIKAAQRGNTSAVKIIFDYLMGPPVQKVDQNNSGEVKIIVEYADAESEVT